MFLVETLSLWFGFGCDREKTSIYHEVMTRRILCTVFRHSGHRIDLVDVSGKWNANGWGPFSMGPEPDNSLDSGKNNNFNPPRQMLQSVSSDAACCCCVCCVCSICLACLVRIVCLVCFVCLICFVCIYCVEFHSIFHFHCLPSVSPRDNSQKKWHTLQAIDASLKSRRSQSEALYSICKANIHWYQHLGIITTAMRKSASTLCRHSHSDHY